jgi:signal transduction histidine kinase
VRQVDTVTSLVDTPHNQREQALGRLTACVAHDVNNLLGVISNNMHLIQRHPAAADLQMPLAAIQRAVESGSQLTQTLLRFARRQPMRPQVVALGQQLPQVQELLCSVLGRRIDVSVQVDAATEPVLLDGTELELTLITLALDASDALPGGGELRLQARSASHEETRGLAGHPGRSYVIISVDHDGAGASTGTDLGLSRAQALCSQAGGTARRDHTPGAGSSVSLLLPAWRAGNVAAGRSCDDR